MQVKFYLLNPKSEVPSAIYARLSAKGYNYKYYIGESILPTMWNLKSQRVKQLEGTRSKKAPNLPSEYLEMNGRIDIAEAVIKNSFRKYLNDHNNQAPTLKQFRDILNKEFKDECSGTKQVEKPTFFKFYEDFWERSSRGNRMNPVNKKATVYNTNKGYKSVLTHLKNFQKYSQRKIDFPFIDLEFYNDYTDYLAREVKLSANTIGDHIKRIKTVLNEATEKGYNQNMAYKSRYFVRITEETDSIYLSESEVESIEALEIYDQKVDQVRDLFVVGCRTGMRWSDIVDIQAKHIHGDYIRKQMIKTGNLVTIPIHSSVKRILIKYSNNLPRKISSQEANSILQNQIAKKIKSLQTNFCKEITKGGVKQFINKPKWQMVSTHTGRRSWCTNEFLAQTPIITIMAISSHSSEKSFLRYIKLSNDDQAKILKMAWDKRSMKAV